MPASASTSPSRGRITATPPKRPASASTAARWIAGSIVVRTALPRRGATEASTRSPARSTPPGRPRELGVELALQPAEPDRARPGGTPRRASSAARSGGAGPMRPATSAASAPSSESARLALGERRAVARLDRRARRQRRACATASRPAAGPGCTRYGRQSIAGAVLELDDGQREPAGERAEDARAQHDRAPRRSPSRGLAGRPARRRAESVATLRGVAGRRAAKRSSEIAPLRLRREQRAHRRVVAALPGLGERRAPCSGAGPRRRLPIAAPATNATPAAAASGASRVRHALATPRRRAIRERRVTGARGGWTSTSVAPPS